MIQYIDNVKERQPLSATLYIERNAPSRATQMDLIKFGIEKMLFPLMEARRGNNTRMYTSELIDIGRMPKEYIQRLQRERLASLLLHCARNVPAYSQLKGHEKEIYADPYKVLTSMVPILGKQQFKQNSEAYLAAGYTDAQRIPNHTGGSTAEPMNFYMDRRQVEHYEAARWRGLYWHGITYGSRSIMVWGNQYELSQQAQAKAAAKEKLLKNRQMISCFALKPGDIDKYIDLLNDYKPEFLYGYSSGLATLAQMIKDNGRALKLNLKAIIATSETLFPWQKELIEEVFRTSVFGEYGARDAGIISYGCRFGGNHLTMENAVFEVLDPVTHEPVAPGTPGVLAVTDLWNYVQPRLRYLLGDTIVIKAAEGDSESDGAAFTNGGSAEVLAARAALPSDGAASANGSSAEVLATMGSSSKATDAQNARGSASSDIWAGYDCSCPCGCRLPMLGSIEGREDAILLAKDGTLVHGDIVCQTLRDYIIVKNGRFVQHDPGHATLMLAFNSGNVAGPIVSEPKLTAVESVLNIGESLPADGVPKPTPGESLPAAKDAGPASGTLRPTPEELETAAVIVDRLKICLGDIDIKTQFVSEIKPSSSGKMRYSIREFPLNV